jgi:hypothetical protein
VGWRSHRRLVLALLCAAACGPDEREPAEHEEVCGEPSPIRILELDPDRPLATVKQTEHTEGRRTLRIGYLADEPDHPEAAFSFGPNVEEYEFWSVGSCGESPSRLSDDAAPPRTLEHWPDLAFACDDEAGEFEIVDPTGDRPRNVVFSTLECRVAETPWGLIEVRPHDDDFGAVVLLPYPEDPWTQSSSPQTLIDPIRIRAVPPHSFPTYYEVSAIFDDELFAITPADDLVRFSLLDGSTTTEAENVREFEVSRDLEWLVWQDATQVGDEVEWPIGAIYLRNRESGETHHLADAALAGANPSSLTWAELGVVRLQLGYLYDEPERLYRLPDLMSIDLPLGVITHAPLLDGRLLVGDAFDRGNFAIVDPVNAEITPVFDGLATAHILDDGLEFLENVSCCITQDGRAEGSLWSVGFDGARELLAHHATHGYQYLSDGRVLTMLDIDEVWRGELIVVDEDLAERVVDDHVVNLPAVDEDDAILYGVSDEDRTGVWLARLAP